jgi:site-specific recombinase XerD
MSAEIIPISSLESILADWHAALSRAVSAGDMSAATATTYRAGMRRFTDWLVSASASTVDAADDIRATVQRFKADMLKRASPASVNVWLAGVKAFYAWAHESGRMAVNPMAGVKGVKRHGANKSHKRDMLTDGEAVRLLGLDLPARDKALIALKLYTGIRDVEAHRANIGDLQTKSGVKVLFITGKGHSAADEFVKINTRCEPYLAGWLAERGDFDGALFTSASDRNKDGRLSLQAMRAIVKDAYRQAGITEPTKTSHSTRHTAITKAVQRAGLIEAQRMARHASPETTAVYLHEANRLANAAEDSIEYGE